MAGRASKLLLVEVEWMDARSVYEQYSLQDAPRKCRLIKRYSLGYVIEKSREALLIAHTFDPAQDEDEVDGAADFTVIPRGWITSITELTPSTASQEKT